MRPDSLDHKKNAEWNGWDLFDAWNHLTFPTQHWNLKEARIEKKHLEENEKAGKQLSETIWKNKLILPNLYWRIGKSNDLIWQRKWLEFLVSGECLLETWIWRAKDRTVWAAQFGLDFWNVYIISFLHMNVKLTLISGYLKMKRCLLITLLWE